jgi:uncharacterized protein
MENTAQSLVSDIIGSASPAQAPKQPALQIVLKIAERCNIACTYCYFFFSGDQSYKEHPPIIGLENAQEILEFIERCCLKDNIKNVTLVLHGGEPLLAPHKTIDYIIDGMKLLLDKDVIEEFSVSMQTNGVLLNDKNVNFLFENKIGLGISIDGLKSDHDAFRVDHKGRGTYDRVIEGYRRAQAEAKKRNEGGPGILSVAQPGRDGAAVFNHFVHDLGIRSMNFLIPDYTHDDAVVDENFIDGVGTFLIDVFRAWTKFGDKNIKVRFIEEILSSLLQDHIAEKYIETEIGYFGLITVSSDGTIAPEDTIKTIAPRFQNLGNVRDYDKLSDVYQHPSIYELESSILNPPEKCASCEFFGICAGSKSVNRYSKANQLNNPSLFCNALISIRLEIAAWLVEAGVPAEDITRRIALAKDGLKSARRLVDQRGAYSPADSDSEPQLEPA